MKAIEKIEMVEVKVAAYVAFDGTEFNSYNECAMYEGKQKLAALRDIEHCDAADGSAPFDGYEHMECNEYVWYKPKDAEEIKLLNIAYDDGYNGLDDSNIGKWVCYEKSDDSAWVYDLDGAIEYAKKLLDKLGFEMTVREKATASN